MPNFVGMKHFFFSLSFLLCAFCALAEAKITWLETKHNFGAFNEEQGAVTCRMPYVNTGDEPLVVIAARSSCGCTQPRFDKTELAPGDTAYLTVSFDPAGRPGRFNKRITVDTNTQPQRSTLSITGVVIGAPATVSARYPVDMGPLKFANAAALLGKAQKMHAKTIFIDGYNRSTDTIAPRIENLPSWLDVTAGPKIVPPGERVSFNFFIRPDRTPLYGFVTDTISIIPDARRPQQAYPLPVIITLEDDFSKLTADDYKNAPVASLPDQRITYSMPAADKAQSSARTSFQIHNSGKSKLLIRRIYSATPGISFPKHDDKVRPGKTITIPVLVTPAEPSSPTPLSAKITIITNDPITPTQTITLSPE